MKTTPSSVQTPGVGAPGKALAWSLWAMTTFFYAFQYIVRVSPNVMAQNIMAKFEVTASHFGDFLGVYYLGYALMHIPIGVLLDRWGPRWVIAASIALSVTGLVPLFYFDSWTASVAGRFLAGAGSSGAILGVFAITRLHFPDHLFSRILGISVMIGLAGAVYGGYPIEYLSREYGWIQVLYGLVAIGAFLSLATAVFTPKSPPQSTEPAFLRLAYENRRALGGRVLITALMAALMVGPLEGFADGWATSFLIDAYGYDRNLAASLPSLIYLGMGVGSPLLALLAERWRAYYPITLGAAAGMGGCFVALLMARPGPWVLGFLFVTIGVLSSYQVLVMYMNSKNADPKLANIVTAFTNMVVMLFGFAFHKAIAFGISQVWDGKIENSLPVYTAEVYTYGLMVIPGALFIAFVGFFFLKQKAPLK